MHLVKHTGIGGRGSAGMPIAISEGDLAISSSRRHRQLSGAPGDPKSLAALTGELVEERMPFATFIYPDRMWAHPSAVAVAGRDDALPVFRWPRRSARNCLGQLVVLERTARHRFLKRRAGQNRDVTGTGISSRHQQSGSGTASSGSRGPD